MMTIESNERKYCDYEDDESDVVITDGKKAEHKRVNLKSYYNKRKQKGFQLQKNCNDEIDDWLLHNVGIKSDCSTDIESIKYKIAREVAEKLWIQTQKSSI